MLIAKMNDSYETITNMAERVWLMERARIVVSIEREMKDVELAEKYKYWVLDATGAKEFQVPL